MIEVTNPSCVLLTSCQAVFVYKADDPSSVSNRFGSAVRSGFTVSKGKRATEKRVL